MPVGAPEITAVLEFVSDERLVDEVARAQLVVLPYIEMHNSGTLLVALSVGRPVLVPRGCVNGTISAEVGDGWVVQYEGELTAADLAMGLEAAGRPRSPEPPQTAMGNQNLKTEIGYLRTPIGRQISTRRGRRRTSSRNSTTFAPSVRI